MKRDLAIRNAEIRQIFGNTKGLSYAVAVSRLAASCQPMLSERDAMDLLDLAELRGEVAIDRHMAIVYRGESVGGADE